MRSPILNLSNLTVTSDKDTVVYSALLVVNPDLAAATRLIRGTQGQISKGIKLLGVRLAQVDKRVELWLDFTFVNTSINNDIVQRRKDVNLQFAIDLDQGHCETVVLRYRPYWKVKYQELQQKPSKALVELRDMQHQLNELVGWMKDDSFTLQGMVVNGDTYKPADIRLHLDIKNKMVYLVSQPHHPSP